MKIAKLPLAVAALFPPRVASEDIWKNYPEGILNSEANPFFRVFGPNNGTAGLTTYREAKKFCHATTGDVMGAQWEWCSNTKAEDPMERGVYGGIRETEQWVPICHWDNHFNNWLLIGPMGGTNYTHICHTWDQIYGRVYTLPPDLPGEGFCFKPTGCEHDFCKLDCGDLQQGYYPSGEDCHSYCYCGAPGEDSYWKTLRAKGKIWDPWCHDSDALDSKNVPLGGMTGGCENDKDYLLDRDAYCAPSLDDSPAGILTSEDIDTGRRLNYWGPTPDEFKIPSWGITSDEEKPFDEWWVGCRRVPMPPKPGSTCADVWGDPHLVTYDGLTYDYQGVGDFVLSKDLDSGFQLQGRFGRDRKYPNQPGSVLQHFVIETGNPGEPRVEKRQTKLFIDGIEIPNLMKDFHGRKGSLATGTDKVHFFSWGHNQYFHFPASGVSVRFRQQLRKKFGHYFNLRICLPDSMMDKVPPPRLVGMLGTPDGDKSNDWMKNDGVGTPIKYSPVWKDAHDYGRENWCIREDSGDSLFLVPGSSDHCDAVYDPRLEEAVKNAPPEVQEVCKGDVDCLVDATAGDGVSDGKSSMESKRILHEERPELKPAPSSSGDPHFKTWTGEKYDFQGGCDLVLLSNPDFADGMGLDVHARTTIESTWSRIDTAAIKLGDHVLEISGGKQQIVYWLDGEEVADMETWDAALGDYAIHFKRINAHQSQTRLDLGHGNALSIETYKKFVRINTKVVAAYKFVGSYGMWGSYPDGKLVGRDKSTVFEDTDEFGMEWQVHATDPQLFHTDGRVQHPMKYAMPDQTKRSQERRRLGEATISEEEAALACARVSKNDKDACIFDVMATNDKEMAGSY